MKTIMLDFHVFNSCISHPAVALKKTEAACNASDDAFTLKFI